MKSVYEPVAFHIPLRHKGATRYLTICMPPDIHPDELKRVVALLEIHLHHTEISYDFAEEKWLRFWAALRTAGFVAGIVGMELENATAA